MLRERVAELRQLASVDRLGVERERATVALYERSLDRSARVLSELVKLDLDTRRTRLLETYGEMISSVFRAVINDPELAFNAEMRDRLMAASSKHLRALDRR